MNGRVRMQGSTKFFTGQLSESLSDCGFDVVSGPVDYSVGGLVRSED